MIRLLFSVLLWAALCLSAFAQTDTVRAAEPQGNIQTVPDDTLVNLESTLLKLRANPNNTLEQNAKYDRLLEQNRRLQNSSPRLFANAQGSHSGNLEEKITDFDVVIDVAESGAITVTENITVISAGNEIRRGIFRELPAKYKFMGVTLENDYNFIAFKKDGGSVESNISNNGNAVVARLGSPNIFLKDGAHSYTIKYSLPEQIRRHRDDGDDLGDRDELYWNATGTYWAFPIEKATVKVNFPRGANIIDTYAYTGARGSKAQNARTYGLGRNATFETTQKLSSREGLTISASIKPGVIAPMSAARKKELHWIRWGGPTLLGLGGLGLLFYYFLMWNRVGRDPAKPPVFARYAPPEGYSAAAVHTIHKKGVDRTKALTATLMSLSIKDVVDIEAKSKKKTTITSMLANRDTANLLPDERKLLDLFFGNKDGKVSMTGKPNSSLYKDIQNFARHLMKHYGKDYHRSNAGWGLLGMVVSVILVVIVMNQPVSKSGPLFLLFLLGIAVMNILFFWLLRAPTQKGAKISAEIEGFKLYLEKAEEARINTANPLGEKPPAMTVELYERFLPYAVALGVEKPWTKYFEKIMPKEAANYQPSYAHGKYIDAGGSPMDMSKAMATALTAGVAAAAPVSQSSSSGGFSSGGGGGGFSGGGGGGGGGGGW